MTSAKLCLLSAWKHHEAELLGFLRHHLAGVPGIAGIADAEDVLQEVFIKALRREAFFSTVEQPRAWLFEIARNTLIDATRARRDFDPLPDDLPAPAGEELATVDRLSQCLPRVLSELCEEDRQAITLCDIEGLSQQALADRLGLSLSGAKSRVQRARAKLRAQLVAACQVRFDDTGQVCCFVPRPPL